MNWNDSPPTQDEIAAYHASKGDWDATPPTDKEVADYARLNADKIMAEKTREMGAREDASGDAFLDTVSLGYLPQIKAKIKQLAAGEGIANDQNYIRRRDAEIADLQQEAKKYPYETAKGKVGGFIAPMLATGGGSAAAESAAELPLLTRLGQGAAQGAKAGAVVGAASNPGDVEGKVDALQLGQRTENAVVGAGIGGGIGAGIPLVGAGIQASGAPAKWAAQKIGKIFTPVSEETTARYLENPDAINAAPTREQISDKIMELKGAADKRVADAHEEFDNARKALSESKLDSRAGLQDQKAAAGSALNEAQAAFNEKKQNFKEALRSNNLTALANETQQAVGELKEKVVQGSKDSYEILGKSGGSVDVQPLINDLQGHIDSMRINGVPRNQAAAQSIEEIRAMQMRLFDMTKQSEGKLTMPQAKQMMQGLDKDLSYDGSAGSFAAPTEEAFKGLRGGIDSSVKGQSEPYRLKMEEVARQAKLLNDTNKLYGTPEKAISNLNNIDSEKGQALHVPILAQLSKETGRDLSQPVQGYLMNQKILSTPSLFDQAIENIPESKALRAAKAKMEEISQPSYARDATEVNISGASQRVESAQAKLESAKNSQSVFSGITPDSITGKQKALTGANSYGAEDRFGKIDEQYGTNFRGAIKARNDLDQFAKDDTHGSRKTVLGGALGALAGAITSKSPEAIAIGTAAGAKIGAAADKYSGPAFKAALDAGMKFGKAAGAAGRALEMAPTNLTTALARSKSMQSSAGAAAEYSKKGPDKWANDGFDKLLDHVSADEREELEPLRDRLMSTPAGKRLLISASDLNPKSRAMDNIFTRVKAHLKGD